MRILALLAVGCLLLVLVSSIVFVRHIRPPHGITIGLSFEQVQTRMRRPPDWTSGALVLGGSQVVLSADWDKEGVHVRFNQGEVESIRYEWLPAWLQRFVAILPF